MLAVEGHGVPGPCVRSELEMGAVVLVYLHEGVEPVLAHGFFERVKKRLLLERVHTPHLLEVVGGVLPDAGAVNREILVLPGLRRLRENQDTEQEQGGLVRCLIRFHGWNPRMS